jgi:hypothetical protein
MIFGTTASVFDPRSEDYNDYTLIPLIVIMLFPIAYIFQFLINYFTATSPVQFRTMIKKYIKYCLLFFIWATFLFMIIGITASVFDPRSEDYNDYPLIPFIIIMLFPIAYIFQILINYFLPTSPVQFSQSFLSLRKRIFEVLVKAVLYFFVVAMVTGTLVHQDYTTLTFYEKVQTAFYLCLGILFISFIERWILGAIIGKRWNPLKIHENGNAHILHIGWLSIFLTVALATIFFGPLISLLFFYDANLLVEGELIFAAELLFGPMVILWGIFVCVLLYLSKKFPYNFIYTRFDLEKETVCIITIRIIGIIFFNLFYKLIYKKVVNFKQIISVEKWEQKLLISPQHGSLHVLTFPTITLLCEPESEQVDLVTGQYLDAEKTKNQIENIIKTSI